MKERSGQEEPFKDEARRYAMQQESLFGDIIVSKSSPATAPQPEESQRVTSTGVWIFGARELISTAEAAARPEPFAVNSRGTTGQTTPAAADGTPPFESVNVACPGATPLGTLKLIWPGDT